MLNATPSAHALKRLGATLYLAGRLDDALVPLRQAAAITPDDMATWDILGVVLHRQGNLEAAIEAFTRAAALCAEPLVLNNLGAALLDTGRFAEALIPLSRAVEILPDVGIRHNLAMVLLKLGNFSLALTHVNAALAQRPEDAELLCTQGLALSATGQPQAAVAALRKSLALHPTLRAHDHLLSAMHEADEPPETILAEAKKTPSSSHIPPIYPTHARTHHPLRIGYLSADFYLHPVPVFFAPLLANHDSSKVEIWCYSSVRRPDRMTQHLQQLSPHWRDISKMNDESAADAIRKDEIDVLVDLNGHTPGNRLGVAAKKPAPVVATYLGYPSTTGLAEMNFRITDSFIDPLDADIYYSEKLVRLAGPFATYQAPDTAPAVGPLPMLGRGYYTFGSFAARGKISTGALEAWGEILTRVPESRLVVFAVNPGEGASIRGPLEAHSIAGERIECVPRVAVEDYLAAHNGVDIMLDTFPLSGHTTVCHALWMGVPAVCLEGRICWQRLGASVLRQVGLGDLVAGTREEYVEIAVGLARDGARLAALRGGLRKRMGASALMDHAGHARRMEEAFVMMNNK